MGERTQNLHWSLAVDSKSNEISAVEELVEMLQRERAIITMDAVRCQKKTLRKIHESATNYLVQVKGNKEKLHKRLRAHKPCERAIAQRGISY